MSDLEYRTKNNNNKAKINKNELQMKLIEF